MKDLFLLLIAAVLIVTNVLTAQQRAKPIEACRHKGNSTYTHHVPHETNCHKFYKCLGGYGYEKDCQCSDKGYLVFNPIEQVCDWEENVPWVSCETSPSTCPGTSVPPPITTPTPTPPITTPTPSPTPPITTPSPTPPITTPTPTPPITTPTPTPPITTPTPTTPNYPPGYQCPSYGEARLPHETDCNYYYICSNGKRERCRCYGTHKFNEYTRNCDLAVNVPWCSTKVPVSPSDDSPKYGLCPPQSFWFFNR